MFGQLLSAKRREGIPAAWRTRGWKLSWKRPYDPSFLNALADTSARREANAGSGRIQNDTSTQRQNEWFVLRKVWIPTGSSSSSISDGSKKNDTSSSRPPKLLLVAGSKLPSTTYWRAAYPMPGQKVWGQSSANRRPRYILEKARKSTNQESPQLSRQ